MNLVYGLAPHEPDRYSVDRANPLPPYPLPPRCAGGHRLDPSRCVKVFFFVRHPSRHADYHCSIMYMLCITSTYNYKKEVAFYNQLNSL